MSGPVLRILAAAALTVAAALGGWASAGAQGQSATVEVQRGPYANQSSTWYFAPEEVHIAPGGSVTWTNPPFHQLPNDAAPHPTACRQQGTARGQTRGECPWGTFALDPGSSYTVTFPAEGTFQFQCELHPWMVGTVIVGDGEPDAPSGGGTTGGTTGTSGGGGSTSTGATTGGGTSGATTGDSTTGTTGASTGGAATAGGAATTPPPTTPPASIPTTEPSPTVSPTVSPTTSPGAAAPSTPPPATPTASPTPEAAAARSTGGGGVKAVAALLVLVTAALVVSTARRTGWGWRR